MRGQHVRADPLRLAYRDRVAARHRDLLLIVPFEAVARGHDIRCRRHPQRLAGDNADLLIDVVDGLIADDGLPLAFDRDMTIGIEAVNFRLAARALAAAIMRGQRIGMHFRRPALGHGVAVSDVDLCILLPLDTGIGRNLDRPILRHAPKAQPLSERRQRAERTADQQLGERARPPATGSRYRLRPGWLEETLSWHPTLPWRRRERRSGATLRRALHRPGIWRRRALPSV